MEMKNLYRALAAFQQEVPNIYKNAKGYSYKFADLGEINDVIKPILQKHGLGYVQPIEGSTIKTIVFHAESGESIESAADIPQGVQLKGMNDFQVLGSAITYLRRYSLSSMLGLITDEDADAAGEQIKAAQKAERKANTDTTTSGADQEIAAREGGDVIKRAKSVINDKLIDQNYITQDARRAFVFKVLKKETIDSIDDADAVMDALENEE